MLGGLLDDTVQSVNACGEHTEMTKSYAHLGSTAYSNGGLARRSPSRTGLAHSIIDLLNTSIQC